ncbi:hypothetical protein [Streptomyces iconiensis]|uniref:DUF4351 domain-containing protein n=1 Tax=Streptomyces iconiensis TaxID=1384038 RepID=A0ABT6ZZZ2_9ACTN|nr:hypothetical protein [Streptomyces iconiensis]MDJ1134645.1 hypothetical protein [Streptomyces iconiensis]
MAPGLFELRGFVAEGLRDEGRAEGHKQGLAEGMRAGLKVGLKHGRLDGRREVLRAMLDRRGLNLSREEKERIFFCNDSELLDLWLRRATTAATAAEVFGEPAASED